MPYQILVGDSSRNLPLSGSVNVASSLHSNVSGEPSRAGSVILADPHGMSSPVSAAVSLPMKAVSTAAAKLTFTATGLPAGLSIGRSGTIMGSARHAGTSTVTVTVTDFSGAADATTFVWTTTKRGKRGG